ncbi:hypothetical protein CAPTEDRAFT_201115 [Capitella teleta]|uniref:VWFD domain-containing protein n=1 Tax=Capitella teleta TaxID=283909 RepID=R7VB06_CAPTE|nr:hypothetical protein CAPTEDRAFT_190809 [Capitella teleta]ELU15697.1 hypothetical protein CAPTEDRAFT_201115 [Capitella teleta]|eukprot:ELT90929.1 hypothetical protein CAPTEDRAFT_190809 [Capitella teleta]
MKQLIYCTFVCLLPLVQSAAPGIYEDFSDVLSREMRQENVTFLRRRTCTFGGDPHYLNENGEIMHFQGACKYIMAQYVDPDNQNMSFTVYTKNEHRGSSTSVSWARYVEIHVFNRVIRLDRNNRVYIDNHEINPWNDMCQHEQFNIFMHGSFVRFETSFGLVVESSGGGNFGIFLSPRLERRSEVIGPCVIEWGFNTTEFWQEWTINDPEDPECAGHVDIPDPECPEEFQDALHSPHYCGLVTNEDEELFRECLQDMSESVQNFFRVSCTYDVCAYYSNPCFALKEWFTTSTQPRVTQCVVGRASPVQILPTERPVSAHMGNC